MHHLIAITLHLTLHHLIAIHIALLFHLKTQKRLLPRPLDGLLTLCQWIGSTKTTNDTKYHKTQKLQSATIVQELNTTTKPSQEFIFKGW